LSDYVCIFEKEEKIDKNHLRKVHVIVKNGENMVWTSNLSLFCKDNNINYKSLTACVSQGDTYKNTWYYYKTHWENISELKKYETLLP
jgi:phospholipase/lecithinase/hemolysin